MSDSLWSHGLQHVRISCPSLSFWVCSDSCPLSWQWHPASHFLLIPSPPALNLSQHQNLYLWVGSSDQVAKVLELQFQHQSFQNIQGWFPLGFSGLNSLLSKGLSRVFCGTTIQNHWFFSTQPSLWSNSHICK